MTTEVESESEHRAECEVCGREVCECPRELGACCICRRLIFNEADAVTDAEGEHWCHDCYAGWPGGEA